MKTTNIKLVAFFVLVSSVLVGCSKSNSDPKPNYSGIYKVTISETSLYNRVPGKTTTHSGNVVVSAGSIPNTVKFTDDLAILGRGNSFEVELVGNAFKLPLSYGSTGAGKFTLNGFEMSTTVEYSVLGGVQIVTRDIIGTKL